MSADIVEAETLDHADRTRQYSEAAGIEKRTGRTYIDYFVLGHTTGYVNLVGEDEETSARQPLVVFGGPCFSKLGSELLAQGKGGKEKSERERRLTHFLHEQLVELFFAVCYAQPVGGIDDPDQDVCLFKVVAPVGAEGFLAADVPFRSRGQRLVLVTQMAERVGWLEGLTDVEFISIYVYIHVAMLTLISPGSWR